MKLTAQNILRSTHYGVSIYAAIISLYEKKPPLPAQLLLVKPVRNPFNGNRKTLLVEIRDGISRHHDLDDASFRGDVFDFANLHFGCDSREALYYMINQALKLGLRPQSEEFSEGLVEDPWHPEVSFFLPPVSNTIPTASLDLARVRDLIAGDTYKGITRKLRQLRNKEARRRFKATRFPYVTFSGSFSSRSEKELLQHSGLLAIDLDHLHFLEEIRQLLLDDDTYSTELLFVSPSGEGLKWILRFDPELREQQEFFGEVSRHLLREYRLQVDVATRDVSRACFLSWDPGVFLHPRHGKQEDQLQGQKSPLSELELRETPPESFQFITPI